MAFEATETTLIHADYHAPMWLIAGMDDGRPTTRLTYLDGTYTEVTSEQRQRLELAFMAADRQAATMKVEAVIDLFGHSVGVMPAEAAPVGPDYLTERGARFYECTADGGLKELRPEAPDNDTDLV
ncbi:hypothetical protein OHA40_26275 [Nocardia sp. NBC_00508]|uniref:hypothetical protein n=1 Tax=Nocardia sp. NBC_00508 TaxID=2975992 RepID=UPI002E80240C|nr:hypothetical protein [Nocardia sp. NBC_00508]WUD65130.1 hypothetical protein OHA40_26275 [Nocardia sp. NBC_00508]